MDYEKRLNFEIEDNLLDYKLFYTLKAIKNTKSQRKAAQYLNISPPVLNRRISKAEELLNEQLVEVSNKGSKLTYLANSLLDEYETLENRLKDDDIITVAGGPISSELIREIAIAYRLDDIKILETDHDTAVELAKKGIVDILGFDDPVYAYLLNIEPIPLARDSLMLLSHTNESFDSWSDLNGLNFVEVEGSSQRLAWNTLAGHDLDFDIKTVVKSFHEAISIIEHEEDLHTFINRSMSYRCQYVNDVLSKQTHHIISAYNVKNSDVVDNFLNFASHHAQNLTTRYGFEKL